MLSKKHPTSLTRRNVVWASILVSDADNIQEILYNWPNEISLDFEYIVGLAAQSWHILFANKTPVSMVTYLLTCQTLPNGVDISTSVQKRLYRILDALVGKGALPVIDDPCLHLLFVKHLFR